MSDIVEAAENALKGFPGQYANNRERMVALFPELLAELKTANDDLGQLLAVATLYLNAFDQDEMMSLTEKMQLQVIEEIVERRGKRY